MEQNAHDLNAAGHTAFKISGPAANYLYSPSIDPSAAPGDAL